MSTRRRPWLAHVLLLAGVVYMSAFVMRGWIPHDEGMIGTTAERVLVGQLPHVDFDEPYTGALSFLYAFVFRVAGVSLAPVRWLVFGLAVTSLFLVYRQSRRALPPIAAASATWVALVWSFPAYFAGVPSWWVLGCALVSLAALQRHIDHGRLRDAALAGLAAGTATAVKQTGLYLVMAVVLALLYRGSATWRPASLRHLAGLLALAGAAMAVTATLALLAPRLGMSEALYLLLPVLAVATMVARTEGTTESWTTSVAPVLVAMGAAVVPLLMLLLPYVREREVPSFVVGAFVAPRSRLAFASLALPPPWAFGLGTLLALCMAPWPIGRPDTARLLSFGRWALLAMLAASIMARLEGAWMVTTLAARSLAVLLPCVLLVRLPAIADRLERRRLVAVAAVLACTSLGQFPYGYLLYVCYVAPLIVLLAVGVWGHRAADLAPLATLMLLFGAAGLNRGYAGAQVTPPLDAVLGEQRAPFRVTSAHADTYGEVLRLVRRHLGAGRLVATPDCPEIYFLAGRHSPDGEVFEFLRWPWPRHDLPRVWAEATVVVVNHAPNFSPAVPRAALAALARSHPHGARVGAFEVRWRAERPPPATGGTPAP